ncbi:NADPH-dependent F420 reductase [Nocardia cyriacigeorgica]|uniref:NADP oxidoreductase n=1 Tax=Nocardia cyriacigeorgica TaxID=135487 RepID=A0A5R8NE08_9NOCA|nr:NAD(P)-binding domain-containing protein [Nocardia cyriacigeorgica]TLF73945.1 NADP oxidoreductase [Nocardia cyriacigeorgica]
MRVAILGTGILAESLATAWARAGHEVVIGGRDLDKARALAARVGRGTTAAHPHKAVAGRAAVLLAVTWHAVDDMLRAAGAEALRGATLIDPTNAVEHGVGVLLTKPGESQAEHIAAMVPDAQVVKAFHLFPAQQWRSPADDPVTVAMCGDDPAALEVAGELVRATGARPAVLGPLARARQLEEVAGFTIGLAFAGVDPNSAIPVA